MSTTTQAARYSADHIDTGSDDEACSRCEGDGCSHCHGRGLVPATSDARCYACDASPVGTRDRRPEGGRVEAACARHAEPKSPATSAPTDEQLRAMTQAQHDEAHEERPLDPSGHAEVQWWIAERRRDLIRLALELVNAGLVSDDPAVREAAEAFYSAAEAFYSAGGARCL